MSTFDIRNNQADDIDTIVFSSVGYGYASRLVKNGSYVTLADIDGGNEADVQVCDFDTLILALRKAQELGWGK